MGKFISTGLVLLVAALAVMFIGCGEETGESKTTTQIVKTLDDLPNCAQGKFAVVYYVMEEEQFYVCGYSTENPNQYGYHVIDPPDDTCTVEDNGDGTKTVRCTDGTDVTFVTVNDVACVHDIGVCEDGDACTDHGCDPALGCHSWPTTCDDGDACTVNGCDSATGCDYSEPVVCDDGNACTEDVCVSPTGCESEVNVFCSAGYECNPDTGFCDRIPVCPCFTEADLNYPNNYFRPGYSYYSYCSEWEPGYNYYSPRLYLSSSTYNHYGQVGYGTNPRTGEIERFCRGYMFRSPNGYRQSRTAFENYAGSGYGIFAPGDYEKCWQDLEAQIEYMYDVQCNVYGPGECDPGLMWCYGNCIDPQTSQDHCGASGDCLDPNRGVACGDGEVCAQGTCECAPGHVSCDGACIDPQTSEAFCGASGDCLDPNAGVACGDGEVCAQGICKASVLVYSSLFTQDAGPTAEQCSDWETFRDGLTGAYTGVRIYGSQNEAGYTCTDPDAVALIAEGLQTRTDFFVICEGNDWQVCTRTYNDELWVNGGSPCNPSNCSGGGSMVRPCSPYGTGTWGGVDTNFCHGPTQTITVEFF
jgi:hypothetical protein